MPEKQQDCTKGQNQKGDADESPKDLPPKVGDHQEGYDRAQYGEVKQFTFVRRQAQGLNEEPQKHR